jgi:virulence-associated protein VapD
LKCDGYILVNGVVSFIENDLKEFVNKTGFDHHDGHLFLNEKDGKPLSAQEITKIFSGITKKLNWPKGKSIYAFRHRYANEQMDIQASVNDELGFTKEENAVALQVSQNMTHRSSKTLLKEYLESRTRHGYKTRVYQQEILIQELRAQIEAQNIEISKALELAEEQREIANLLQKEVKHLKKTH